MLTGLKITNFKRFEDVAIELGDAVVFIGPNNSGKTTALQALSLWEIGLRRWLSKRKKGSQADERQGVAVNRRDLPAIPAPSGRLLWRDLSVRNVFKENGNQVTRNILIGITVTGITEGQEWQCGLEFDYANEESFYVRPLRLNETGTSRLPIPDQAKSTSIAFLPPMSGLAADEYFKQPGEISVLIGQGQTAQVLRNLCYYVCYPQGYQEIVSPAWIRIVVEIRRLFGVRLLPPEFLPDRAEIRMQFDDQSREGCPRLDLSAAGRGLQQTLLLLSHIYRNPGTVLLLDEPDAHLEVLRQRQIYQLIQQIAREQKAQIIAASHSEVVLNEAANTGKIVAFVGKPHVLTDRPQHVLKSLTTLGWDQYYEAELRGWILYVEDATDLAILRAFARKYDHPVREHLEGPFVHYVATNLPELARSHYYGLREAKSDLCGIAVFDRLEKQLHVDTPLVETMWKQREIENYFTSKDVLFRWANPEGGTDLFSLADREEAARAMNVAIDRVTDALALDGKDPWSPDTKASDEVLDRVFRAFFQDQGLPVTFRKADYWQLVDLLQPEEMDREVMEKLDLILQVAQRASPRI